LREGIDDDDDDDEVLRGWRASELASAVFEIELHPFKNSGEEGLEEERENSSEGNVAGAKWVE